MILQLRLDERLVHGQVATQWCRVLDVDAIVVANDDADANPILKKTLVLGAPAGKKVVVRNVADAITLLKDPRSGPMKILLIVDNPKDATTLVKALDIKEVNIANFVKKQGNDRVQLGKYCYANPHDLLLFKELCETGAHVYSQMIPAYAQEDVAAAVRKALG